MRTSAALALMTFLVAAGCSAPPPAPTPTDPTLFERVAPPPPAYLDWIVNASEPAATLKVDGRLPLMQTEDEATVSGSFDLVGVVIQVFVYDPEYVQVTELPIRLYLEDNVVQEWVMPRAGSFPNAGVQRHELPGAFLPWQNGTWRLTVDFGGHQALVRADLNGVFGHAGEPDPVFSASLARCQRLIYFFGERPDPSPYPVPQPFVSDLPYWSGSLNVYKCGGEAWGAGLVRARAPTQILYNQSGRAASGVDYLFELISNNQSHVDEWVGLGLPAVLGEIEMTMTASTAVTKLVVGGAPWYSFEGESVSTQVGSCTTERSILVRYDVPPTVPALRYTHGYGSCEPRQVAGTFTVAPGSFLAQGGASNGPGEWHQSAGSFGMTLTGWRETLLPIALQP